MLPLLLLAAEAVTPKPATVKPVDPTAAAVFWKAQAEFAQVKSMLTEKEVALKAALEKVSCESGYELVASNGPLGLECRQKEKAKVKDAND